MHLSALSSMMSRLSFILFIFITTINVSLGQSTSTKAYSLAEKGDFKKSTDLRSKPKDKRSSPDEVQSAKNMTEEKKSGA